MTRSLPVLVSAVNSPKKLRVVSPSQIGMYRQCARLWFNNYQLGLRGPVPQFLSRGTAIHAALEHFLKTGEVLLEVEVDDAPGVKWPTMEFVQAAIPHLPKPINDPYWDPWRVKGDAGLMLEQPGELGTWTDPDGTTGPRFVQFLDMVEAYPDRITLRDHKTLSDQRYQKSPEELSNNLQLLCNAKWAASVGDYSEFTLQHMYLLTKGKRPKCWVVSTTVTREHVEAEWLKIMATVREMAAWADLAPPTAEVLPPNTDSCGAYGGCFHKSRCFGAGASSGLLIQINRTMSKGESMSLIEQMKARASAAVAGQTSESVAPVVPSLLQGKSLLSTDVGAPSPAPSGVLGKLLAGKVSAVGQQTVSPLVAGTAPLVGSVVVIAPLPVAPPAPQTVGELPGYDPNGILPPDSPIPTSTPEEVAEASGEVPSSTETPAEGTKRKRRTKAEMEAARMEMPAAVVETAKLSDASPTVFTAANTVLVYDQAKDAEEKEQNPAVLEMDRLRAMLLTPDPAFACPVQAIFIDCMPSKGWPGEPAVDLGSIMHSFNGLAAASAQVTDYRLIPYSSNGYLATAIKATMANLPTTLFVDSRLPGAAVFLEVVLPYSRLVVRGVR